MKLRLVKASADYRDQITDMLDEWNATGEKIIPYAIRRLDYHDFAYYCDNLEVKDTSGGLVPDSTFFCLDERRNRIVGAVNIRHYLNESLLLNGGHIGDGVRPSERRKGIATAMIALALEECRKLGIGKVLMVCDKENVGSAKSIQNNGGVLENEVTVGGIVTQRYWIDLNERISICEGNHMENIVIRKITAHEVESAMALALEVFMEFEAPDYGPAGVETFKKDIVENPEYLEGARQGLCPIFGAFDGDKIVALMGMRSSKTHINLVFTKKEYHRKGIARTIFRYLLQDILKENPSLDALTLNSSPYGLPFYLKIGFVPQSEEQTINGIRFTPMKYIISR